MPRALLQIISPFVRPFSRGGEHPLELKAQVVAGHGCNVNDDALRIVPFPITSASSVWAWQQGLPCLLNQPLEDAVAEVKPRERLTFQRGRSGFMLEYSLIVATPGLLTVLLRSVAWLIRGNCRPSWSLLPHSPTSHPSSQAAAAPWC
jgi:hypothetical protein